MKNKMVKALAIMMSVSTITMMGSASVYASETETETATEAVTEAATEAASEDATEAGSESDDQAAADNVAALIDKIYVQERTDTTDADCTAAKEAWDQLTDAQKELVEGEEASPEYFGRDTGDASKDDPRNGDEIGDNELLVVSFGTSSTTAVQRISKASRMLCRKHIRIGL